MQRNSSLWFVSLVAWLALVASARAAESVLFNGTTSKAQHDTAAVWGAGEATVVAWAYATGNGEGNSGTIICTPENSITFMLGHQNAADTWRVFRDWTTTDGGWNFSAPDNQWNGVAIVTDNTGTDPPYGWIRRGTAEIEAISFTEVSAPTGTPVSIQSGACIGNISSQVRTWAGSIAWVVVYDTALTDDQMKQSIMVPGSVPGYRAFWYLLGAADMADRSGNDYTLTATDLADGQTGVPRAWPLLHYMLNQ